MIKLHIGCGPRDFGNEWIHIDGGDFPHVDPDNHDVFLNHYPAGIADEIYSSHLLSYFDRADGSKLLKQWYNVLKPGGLLRVAVPDFEALVKYYTNGDLSDILGPLYGKMTLNGESVFHKTTYDYYHLRNSLMNVGFTHVERYNWFQTCHADIDDHSRAHLPHDTEAIRTGGFTTKHTLISLNLQAIK